MKTKQEQIEEIKQVLIKTCKRCRLFEEDYMQSKYAEALYNAGYRKIPENAVVLTKEEYIDLSRNYVTEQIEQVRKETAEKILNELIDSSNKITFFDCRMALGLDKLAKQYGVEVEE